MTVGRGEAWGTTVPRPDQLRLADDDQELARMLTDGTDRPVAVRGGDVHTTIGAPNLDGRQELNAFPIDVLWVRLDGGAERAAIAHVLARSSWRRGGWWRGEALAVMNAEYVGRYDVVPRGHPNDGRVETLHVDATLGIRQRWAIRTRLPSGSHLPHPAIDTGSVRSADWEFRAPLQILVDGVDLGPARSLAVRVEPDGGVVHA